MTPKTNMRARSTADAGSTIDSTRRDDYPSRQGRRPELLERVHPVVYPGAKDPSAGPLGAVEVDRFDRDGYLILEGVFDAAEVAALDQAITDRAATLASDSPRLIVEPESADLRSIFAVHDDEGPLADTIAGGRLAGVARQLLGSDVTIHQSRVNRKPGVRGKEFAWHSDFETWHTEDGMPTPRCLSASVALTDNHVYNGPLLVMPGSHRWFVTCPEPTPPANHRSSLARQSIGIPDDESLATLYERCGIDVCTGPAGSVTFFDCNLLHGSSSNISPLPRRNLFSVYLSVENALQAPFAAAAPRPAHIADRNPVAV